MERRRVMLVVSLTSGIKKGAMDISYLKFEDLFNLEDIQEIQDAFAAATGVASIITDVNGTPITRPSGFCTLCNDVIRKTPVGLRNCMKSDALLGRPNSNGPTIQACLSGGLLDAGASIMVGNHHIANWLIGQVWDTTADPQQLSKYAAEIGADEQAFEMAMKAVTRMPREQFENVCQALYLIAAQLSRQAVQNVQQARTIAEREQANVKLTRVNRLYRVVTTINQAAARAQAPEELYRLACQALVEVGEFEMAWVGLLDPSSQQVVPTTWAGQDQGYLGENRFSAASIPKGLDPIRQSVSEKRLVYSNNVAIDPNMAIWKEEALKRGYRSLASFILGQGEKVRGVLAVYSSEEDFFDEEEIRLLEEVSATLSFTLEAMEEEKRRQEAEKDLQISEARIQNQLRRLSGLRTIDTAINAKLSLPSVMEVILDQVMEQLQVSAADILLVNPESNILRYGCGKGFQAANLEDAVLSSIEGLAGSVIAKGVPIKIADLANEPRFTRQELLQEEHFHAYYGLPLTAKGKTLGVMEIFLRGDLNEDAEWVNYLETLAGQAAIAVEDARMYAGLLDANLVLSRAYDETIEGWARTLDLRDHETEGHSRRVTDLTLKMGKAMGLADEELVHIRRGALLHDIGKVGVPDQILLKPGQLSPEEWEIMRRHPQYAFDLLSPIPFLRPALEIPYCHHEKWDGSGYPRGLKGEEIPQAARIFAVVDVWDALLSDRPYRKGWPLSKVKRYIREQSLKHFDPGIVKTFFDLVRIST